MARARFARKRGQRKAAVSLEVRAHAPLEGIKGPGKDWRKENVKRMQGEITALEKELESFDAVAAAAKVRQTMELELKRKKLQLEQEKLEMGGLDG